MEGLKGEPIGNGRAKRRAHRQWKGQKESSQAMEELNMQAMSDKMFCFFWVDLFAIPEKKQLRKTAMANTSCLQGLKLPVGGSLSACVFLGHYTEWN